LPRRRALLRRFSRRRFERGRVFDVVTTLGSNLSPAILDAGYPPAWQVEADEVAELAHPVGKLGTAQQRTERAARPARDRGREVEHFWKAESRF
jgi:hypothetical protein